MLIFYNFIQLLGLIILAPVIVCVIIFKPKYRGRIFKRLGFGLTDVVSTIDTSKQRIWIHALSVGEVSSVRSLVEKVRVEFPKSVIIFSSTTRSGEQHARVTLADYVDVFIPFPLDNYWVARFFITSVSPDFFVLVETDFWPNFLCLLKKKNIPAVLVNGRISGEAFANYRRFRFLFQPMFESLRMLAVQREDDVSMLSVIGVPKEKVTRLGNLKYDVLTPSSSVKSTQHSHRFSIPEKKTVWVAGSTHPGEEEILLNVCNTLQERYPDLFLVIAPREIDRAQAITQLAEKKGITMFSRTEKPVDGAQGMILNTLGELASVYSLADFAFVGGSLVPRRGHNPLEPAAKGKLVLFGPHMQDFIDIVTDMLNEKVAIQVDSEENMEIEIRKFLENPKELDSYGRKAAEFVRSRQGVTERHIDLLRSLL
jgi:3-deoxy-D-manno-octulosonic-acid transferase